MDDIKEIYRKMIGFKKDKTGDKYTIYLVLQGFEFHTNDKHGVADERLILGSVNKKDMQTALDIFRHGDFDVIEVADGL